MMIVSGSLVNNHIIVEKPKDLGRLFNKSHFGQMLSNERLQLSLIEGVFLLDENKIKILYKNKNISFQDLVKIAVNNISDFETKYLIFKDLRNRGLAIKLCKENIKTTFYHIKPRIEKKGKQIFISTFSERDVFDLDDTEKLIDNITKKNGELWFGIADEEGDITYYSLSILDLRGTLEKNTFSKTEGLLLRNRVILFNKLSKNLFKKEFFGKPFRDGLQLSLVEAIYLLQQNIISLYTSEGDQLLMKECIKIIEKSQPDIRLRFVVFKDLKRRGLLVKTGFKFGAHFRAYTKSINETHAEFLIHVVNKGFTSIWAEMSRAVRLAHSVNKEIVLAKVDGKKISYIKIGRLRP
jgi:tRNA-intron endonuclease